MEVEEIQATQACKFPRVVASANGRLDHDKINNTDDKQERDLKMVSSNNNNNNSIGVGANDDFAGSVNNRLRGWHHSSRIIRVSRASGGKDRHSKVWTSKGLRDRRVRLSVPTAIQFYDLQDRLGYDQPSKAVEWLIKHASDAIAELPALNSPFPETPRQPSDEKRTSGDTEQGGLDSAEAELDGSDAAAAAAAAASSFQQQQQHLSLPKSACSSTSETSKGSGLSLSRSDIRESRVKRRERARERTAKEKETTPHHQNVNPISQNSTFTELLTGGGGGISIVSNHTASPTGSSAHLEPNFFQKQQQHQAAARQWPTVPMDYFGSHSSAFPGHIHLGNSLSQAFSVQAFNNGGGENHSELQHFPFVTDHHLMSTTSACNNFSISCSPSSGLAGFINNNNNNNSRGTLQSNSSSPSFMMPHLQRFPPIDGSSSSSTSNFPFFIGTAAAAPPMENHHQHHQVPSGLQLYYTDGNSRHSDHKGKGKN